MLNAIGTGASEAPLRYGVHVQNRNETLVDRAVESLRLNGFAIIDGGYSAEELAELADAFERAQASHIERMGGLDRLKALDEHHTVRLPLSYEPFMLGLAMNANVLAACRRLVGNYIVLNQQNGVINPPNGEMYNQGYWHRDLAYQHYTSSRPLAINALFCLDEFRPDNGATLAIPGSHKIEEFPSDEMVNAAAIQVQAPAGSFILLDCMTYHTGGVNHSPAPRRAVNHVYTIPLIKQQIDMPRTLGPDFTDDAEARKILGYGIETPLSVEDYIAGRAGK